MRRREFMTLVGGAATWPTSAFAERRLPRVGILLFGQAAPSADLQICGDLARIGYVEGRDITYEIRAADGDLSRLLPLARDLVATKPTVLVGSTAQVAIALSEATHDIPIVITLVSDPIAIGLSASISRPSRNVTGFTISSLSLAAKRLELLHELVPAATRIAYLWAPQNPSAEFYKSKVQQAAETLGVDLVPLPLTSEADLAGAFARADEAQVKAVLAEADILTYRLSGSIVDQCLIRNLPAMHSWSIEVRNGALMSYGPAEPENNARAAVYVDRILKGAKVTELPFEEPTEIKLAINMRTARSIGLVLPPAFVMRADEVIE
jgi:putative ABC transport system substrate-binding protein